MTKTDVVIPKISKNVLPIKTIALSKNLIKFISLKFQHHNNKF